MTYWKNIIRQSVTTFHDLKKHLICDNNVLEDLIANFQMRINPFFLSLIKKDRSALWLQAVPDIAGLRDTVCIDFRPSTHRGVEIMCNLIGHISGMAIPTYAIEAPGGKGKIPLSHEYIISHGKKLFSKTTKWNSVIILRLKTIRTFQIVF